MGPKYLKVFQSKVFNLITCINLVYYDTFITAMDITSKFAISIMVGAKAVEIMMSILHLSKGTGDDSVTL